MEQDLNKIIDKMSKKELQFIVKLFVDNVPVCKSLLFSRYIVGKEKSHINRLKGVVDNLVIDYSDKRGFIDYRNAWDFCCELVDLLEDNIDTFIKTDNYSDAFELIIHILNTMNEVEMDDSDGGCTIVYKECFSELLKIVDDCEDIVRKKIFEWAINYKDEGERSEYAQEHVDDLIRSGFDSEDELRHKIRYYDMKIEELSKKYKANDSDYYYSCYENYVLDRINTMYELHYSESEINTYKNKFRFLSRIRRMEIIRNLMAGNIDKAIELLKESKTMDSSKPELVKYYSEQLINLYEKIGNMDLYKKELLLYIYSNFQENFIYIDKIKEISSEEDWQKVREELIENRLINKYEFMDREGMYERMISELEKSPSILDLKVCEHFLRNRYPERLRNLYVACVQEEINTANNRGKYRELISYLNRIKEYDGGEKIVGDIVKKWKEKFSRRLAMIDELNKAGF